MNHTDYRGSCPHTGLIGSKVSQTAEKSRYRRIFSKALSLFFLLTAALLFTAGFGHVLNDFFTAITKPGATLTVALYFYAKEDGEFGVAFAIASILMAMTLLLNIAAGVVTKRFGKEKNNE